MDLGISGRTALVCGSSSGLGFAAALTLAREGCRVVLNSRDPKRAEAAAARVHETTGAATVGIAADVARREEAERLVERAQREYGAVDILVTNAGGPPALPFPDIPEPAWQDALDLNLLSTIHLCRAAVPGMRARRWGRIICITSIAAKQPVTNLILSTTARAGVLGFAKALSDEVAADGVTVNALCPGYTRTDRVEELLTGLAAQRRTTRETEAERIVGSIPARRMGEPDEFGAVVAFLASERAAYVTGVALSVDGGAFRGIL
jgi:3-oxoacyl-[acyl-carrier protein] reductase